MSNFGYMILFGFGIMPSMKDSVTEEETKIISEWLFDNFPHANFVGLGRQRKMKQGGVTTNKRDMMNRVTFENIDKDGNGMISSEEFNIFRSKKR